MFVLSFLLLLIGNTCGSLYEVDDSNLGIWISVLVNDEDLTTLTLKWDMLTAGYVGWGYGGRTMDGTRAIIVNGDTESDVREYQLTQHFPIEITVSTQKRWTAVTDTTADGNRTIVYTTPNIFNPDMSNEPDSRHTKFDPDATAMQFIWCRGSSNTLLWHGNNRESEQVDDTEIDIDTKEPTTTEEVIVVEPNDDPITPAFIDFIFSVLKPKFDVGPLHKLIATTIRLIFHDCGGPTESGNDASICNGCIDYDNGDHAGLVDLAINILEQVFVQTGIQGRMSRADYWATAATLAVKYAQELDTDNELFAPIQDLNFYFGREDCESSGAAGDVGTNQKMEVKIFPNAKGSFQAAATWFNEQMDFTTEETLALLGVHTLGLTHPFASGFGAAGNTFWVQAWDELDNDYYIALQDAHWAQQSEVNDVFQWFSNTNKMMLNADFGMYFNLEQVDCDDSGNGFCNCVFPACDTVCDLTPIECPRNNNTADQVDMYAADNELWLADFAKIYDKLTRVGYELCEDVDNVKPCLTVTDIGATTIPPETTVFDKPGTTEETKEGTKEETKEPGDDSEDAPKHYTKLFIVCSILISLILI